MKVTKPSVTKDRSCGITSPSLSGIKHWQSLFYFGVLLKTNSAF